MALDKEYFDSIKLEIAKKKYYNANKVEAVLADIKEQAFALTEENENLKLRMSEIVRVKGDISDTLLSAKSISRTIISEASDHADDLIKKAEAQAADAVAEAENRAAALIAEAEGKLAEVERRERDLTARYTKALEKLRVMQLGIIDELDEELEAIADEPCQCEEQEAAAENESVSAPEDLEEKISSIAEKLFSIGLDEDTDE